MRRFDVVGGWFVRIGRWWLGLVAEWPFVVRVPVIAGAADVTDTFYAGEAIAGYGGQWEIGDNGSPEAFEAVADVISITFGDMSTAVIEKTHLRSPAAHREKLATLRDSGPFSMRCNYRPTHESQSNTGGGTGAFTGGGILAMWIARSEHNMKIVLNDGSPATELPFRGVITKYQPGEITPDGKIELTVEVTPLQDFSANMP